MGKQQKQTQKTSSCKFPAQHRSQLSCSTPPPHQNLQLELLHNMQTEEHNNGQMCQILDHTSKELPKLYWDAGRLME